MFLRTDNVITNRSSSEEEEEESSSEEEEESEYDEEDSEYDDDDDDALDALIDSVVDYEDPKECWDLVRTWLSDHSLEETKSAVELKGEFDTTALHVACRNKPPVDVVDIMLMAAPDMIFWADSFGWLPVSFIHLFACIYLLHMYIYCNQSCVSHSNMSIIHNLT